MPKTVKDRITLIRQVTSDHEQVWEQRRPEMARYRSAYLTRFYEADAKDGTSIRVETADGYAFIESYVSSLFNKNPAIMAFRDHSTEGDPKVVQACANRFFNRQREPLENATRMALIYPSSFAKLAPQESEDMLERVAIRAIEPWNVIVDIEADRWDTQRFVGHIYFMQMSDASARWGNKDWQPIRKKAYFSNTVEATRSKGETTTLPDAYLYIKVVEFYDLVADELCFWSPNYASGDKLIEKSTIPVRTYDDRPFPGIVPLYYGRIPDSPLEGYSAMSRIYDQLFEKNIMRTHWANAVRRDSRQFLYRSDILDENMLAKVSAGVDGAMIGVEGETLDGLLKVVDTGKMSSDFDRYAAMIEQDLSRGSLQAPFAHGEATKATATEITAMAQYSASEIGRLARERDSMISMLAALYIRMILVLTEDGDTTVIEVKKKPVIITAEALDGRFTYIPLDQAGTPLSNSYERQQLLTLLPVLTQMGIPQPVIRDELLRLFDLPDSFREAAEAAMATVEEEAEQSKRVAAPAGTEMPEGAPTESAPQQLADSLMGAR